MAARLTSRDLMIVAIALAALLDFSANWLALVPWRRAKDQHWTERARLYFPVRVAAASNLWVLPAVLTIQSGINKLRYATLLGIKQAKNKPLRKVTLDEVKSSVGNNMQKVEKLYIPQKSKKTEMLEGSPGEVAKKLVEKLRNEVRVI